MTDSNLGEEVWDILTALEADKQIGNLEEEEVAIIEEIVEVLDDRKTSYQLFEIYQRTKEEVFRGNC